MLSSVLAAITCVAIPVTDPLQVAAQTSPGEALVEVGTHVTPTTFRSRNFSDAEQLLVFGSSAASVPPCVIALPPGAIVEYEFTQQAVEGLMLEVVSLRDGHMTRSGANSLVPPAASVDMTLWTVPSSTRLTTWQQVGCEVTCLSPQGSLLPGGWTDSGSGTEAASAPPNAVPITPPQLPPPVDNEPYTPM